MTDSTDTIPFNFDGHATRTIMVDGEPWFIASDVAAILGYSETAAATRTLDEDDKGLQTVQTLGGPQSMTAVNESGLYALILGSRLESAKRFKRWITKEVLPSIRKTGGYGTPAGYASAMQTVAHVLRQADAELEHRTRHDFYRVTSRAQERRAVALVETASKYGLDAEALKVANDRGTDEALASIYRDPAAISRVQRSRAAIEAELAQRMRLPAPRRRNRKGGRR